MSQDSLGLPQKLGPCGNEAGGTPTGAITTFAPGATITVTINEVIFHPGHYRAALAVNSQSELPAEPVVTPDTTPCGTAAIESPAVYPVLGDGLLTHTTAFTAPQSFQITLPTNVTCTNCTLQIIEFMAEHGLNNPGGCFYHHCANIAILPDAGTTTADGGMGMPMPGMPGADGGMGAPGGTGMPPSGAGPGSVALGDGGNGAPAPASGSVVAGAFGCGVSALGGATGLLSLLGLASLARRRHRLQ
jgi:hypothetical protein